MNELEKKIIEKIDEMRDEIIKFHQQIVQIPSENPPSKYKDVAKFTEKIMKEIGLETTIKRNNLVGTYVNNHEHENGRSLIFYGHYDTVEAFKGWTKDPFGGEVVDGKIYGRGSSDDKSSVTAEIFATKALLELGVNLRGKLTLTAVGDEETGGLRGLEHLLNSGVLKGDVCLLGDAPCDYAFGYTGGTIYATITIKGKQAHGLAAPDLPAPFRNEQSGINTIERMVKIMNYLIELNKKFLKKETNYPIPDEFTTRVSHINLAEIHGGNKITTVPDKCYLHFSLNTIPEQDVESIKVVFLKFVDQLKAKDPDLDITVQMPIQMEPFVIDGKSEFTQAVKKAVKSVYKEEKEFQLFMPSTDAHWFQEKGIETILVGASRYDNNWHSADEFVYIEDLMNLTKLYALSALNYLK